MIGSNVAGGVNSMGLGDLKLLQPVQSLAGEEAQDAQVNVL